MSVVDAIKHYQRSLEKCSNDSSRVLHCIYKLYKLPITVQHLQETGVGRTVNSLRKYDGDTGEAAKALVTKWKSMVMDEDSCGENEEQSPEQSSDDSSHHHKRSDDDSHDQKRSEDNSHHRKRSDDSSHHQKKSDERRKDKSSSEHKRDHKRKSDVNSYSSKKKRTKDKIKVEEEDEEESSEQEESNSRVRGNLSLQEDDCMSNKKIKEEIDDEIRRVAEEEDYQEMEDPGVEDSGGEENSSRLHIAESDNEDSSDMLHVEDTAAAEETEPVSRKRSTKGESSDHHRSKSESSSHHSSLKKHKDKHKEKHKDKNREKEKRSNTEKSRHESDVKSGAKPMAADTKVKEPCLSDEKKKSKHDAGSSSKEVDIKIEPTVPSKTHSKDKVNTKPKKIKKEKDNAKKTSKKLVEKTADGSIDCFSGASFAEALGMVDPLPTLKKSRVSSPSVRQDSSSSKKSLSNIAEVNSTSSKPQSSSTKLSTLKGVDLLSPNTKLKPLEMEVDVDMDVEMDSHLPEINPNYRPLPHFPSLDSPPHKKGRLMTEEEALSRVMSTKNQRTKVYSGLKSSKGMLKVPTLLELCTRVLIDNIDAMEYTGGVPYELLEPVLKHATPQQLFTFEHYNPYLIGDTNELWTFHVNKEFRSKEQLEYETSRDMYIRCVEEREEKLKALTSNIQLSIAKSTPVRQTKLAYVDSVAKPPRSIARKQAKYGTAALVKASSPGKSPRPVGFPAASSAGTSTAPVTVSVPPPAPSRVPVAKVKPRVAPLMQKTMKLVKSLKR